MKTYIVKVVSAIFVGVASTAYAASTTVTINAIDASGKATKAVTAPHLTVADVKGRSIMIHAGGDNYSDQNLWAAAAGALPAVWRCRKPRAHCLSERTYITGGSRGTIDWINRAVGQN